MPGDLTKTYSEDEAHAIFARAARKQEAARQADERAGSGLTLAELKEVGTAAGIEPDLIESAARSLAVGTEPGLFLGVPERVHASRTLPAPVGDASWAALVDALRLSYGHEGRIEQIGPRRTWTMTDPVTNSRLTVLATGRVVTLDEPFRPRQWYAPALLPLALVVFFLLGTFEPGIPILMASLALVAVLATRFGMPAWGLRQERRFQVAVDHVELSMLRAQREIDAETAPPERIDVATLDFDVPDAALTDTPDQRRRRDRA